MIAAALLGFVLALPGTPTEAQVVLSEVLFDPIGLDTGRQLVEIRNVGPFQASIGGWWLLLKPSVWQIPDGTTLMPGGTVVIHLNRSGSNTETDLFTGTSGMRNLRREDALALFSENLFAKADKLVDFVEWGASGQAGEEVAIEAGKWRLLDPVPVQSLREGSTIAYAGSGVFASSWCVDGTPSIGRSNDGCTVSRAHSPVRLNEVRPGPQGLVELKNEGQVIEDLEGKLLLNGSSTYRFPAGTFIFPGELLLVRLGASGIDTPQVLHTGPGFADLGPSDSLALFVEGNVGDFTLIFDFVQWGSRGRAFEAQAVEAGIWPAGEAVDISRLLPGGSAAAKSVGSGSNRWEVDNTPTPGEENATPPVSAIILNEVLLASGQEEAQAVELLNRGSEDLDLSGWSLCARPDGDLLDPACAALPPGTLLEPGGFLVVRLGAQGAGPGEVVLSLPVLRPAGGELALLLAVSTPSPNDFLDYFRWGNGNPILAPDAEAAGLWLPGDTFDTALLGERGSLAYTGSGRGAASWRLDSTPSLGQPNAERPPEANFVRSDCNQDREVDISDPIGTLTFLFSGGAAPRCEDACDSNDDGTVDISDAVTVLGLLFLGRGPPRPPTTCGPDTPTPDTLPCLAYDPCL